MIWVFKCGVSNYTALKHVQNEYVKLIESYFAHFDNNSESNLTQIEPVIGMDDIVLYVALCYTRYYLTPGICSPIQPVWKMVSFPFKPTQSCCYDQLRIFKQTRKNACVSLGHTLCHPEYWHVRIALTSKLEPALFMRFWWFLQKTANKNAGKWWTATLCERWKYRMFVRTLFQFSDVSIYRSNNSNSNARICQSSLIYAAILSRKNPSYSELCAKFNSEW